MTAVADAPLGSSSVLTAGNSVGFSSRAPGWFSTNIGRIAAKSFLAAACSNAAKACAGALSWAARPVSAGTPAGIGSSPGFWPCAMETPQSAASTSSERRSIGLGSHLSGHRNAAAGAARGPAADDAGEHPGIAAGADDHQPARAEFVDGLAGERGGAAFGDALGAGDQFLAGDLTQLVELFVEPRLRPASLAEGALVLGADHQEGVAGRRQFDAVDRLQRLGHAA